MTPAPQTQRRVIVCPVEYIAASEAPMTDDPIERKKYRTELPNMLDDSTLSVYAFRLYVHVKRVAGANGGGCRQGARTMSKICNMSPGQIAKAKKELLEGGWITRTAEHTNGGEIDVLWPVDLWEQNYAMYARSEPVPQPAVSVPESSDGDRNTITMPEGDHTAIKGDRITIKRKNSLEGTEKECAAPSARIPPATQEPKTKKQEAATPIAIREAMADVCKIDMRVASEGQKRNLHNMCKTLWETAQLDGVSDTTLAEQIRYVGSTWWYEHHWIGQKKNEPPTPTLVCDQWGRAMEKYNAPTAAPIAPPPPPERPPLVSGNAFREALKRSQNGGR